MITKRYTSGQKTLLLMSVPCFLFVIAFSYVPLFGWIFSFFDYEPGLKLYQCDFVGLKYFKLALFEPDLLPVLRNTLVMSFLGILSTVFPVIFAILLSEIPSRKFKKITQTATTLPNFISWILVFSIFFAFFNTNDGLINIILLKLGIISEPGNILANSDAVWLFQTAIGIWKSVGFGAIIYIAAIAGIDPELYDAAKVDGAGRFRVIMHITVPGLASTYVTLLLLNIGSLLSNGFDQYFVFYNPLVHDKIQVLDYYLYRIGIVLNDYSFSTALGMTKTIISIILLTMANLASKKLRGQVII